MGSIHFDRTIKWEELESFCRKLGLTLSLAKKLKKKIANIKIDKISLEDLSKAKELVPYVRILNKLFDLYLETGGYPSAIEAKIHNEELPFNLVLQDILGTIEKEGLSLERLNLILPRIVKGLGVKIELKSLAPQMSESTLSRYISTLEKSFLLRKLYFFDGISHPKKGVKLYFTDPFITRAISRYYGIREPDPDQIVEGSVIEAVARHLEIPFTRLASHTMGYGKIKRKEVDIVTKDMKIEIKYRKSQTKTAVKGVDLVLTRDEFSPADSDNPTKIPVSFFLVML